MANSTGFYPMQRRIAETERLNTQHRLLVRAAGCLLHPSIKRKLPLEPKIAELATGTGIFLTELSEELPSEAAFDGFDISDNAFTPNKDLPKNVSLSILDAKHPAPAELQGKYDVVLIRFMNIALPTDEDWLAVAEHASSLLKPGGALQWIEAGFQSLNVVLQTEPETKTTAIEKGQKQVEGMFDRSNWYITHLSEVLQTAGFATVKKFVTSTDRIPEDRNPMSKIATGAMETLMRFQTQIQTEGSLSTVEVERLIAEMKDEIDGGAYFRVDMHQFVAFKAE